MGTLKSQANTQMRDHVECRIPHSYFLATPLSIKMPEFYRLKVFGIILHLTVYLALRTSVVPCS
jgi:hypothetical protein